MFYSRIAYTLSLALLLCTVSVGSPYYPVDQLAKVTRQNPLFTDGYATLSGDPGPGASSGTYKAGIFGFSYTQPDGTPFPDPPYVPDFKAICIDPTQTLFSSSAQLFYIGHLDTYPDSLIDLGSSYQLSFSSAQKQLLEQLFTIGWWDVQNTLDPAIRAIKSAAFQWAAWEIKGESTPGTLESGSVYINSQSGQLDNNVRAQANAYLSSIDANTARTQLLLWSPVEKKTRTIWVSDPNGTTYKYINGVKVWGYWKYEDYYVRTYGQELLTPVPEPSHIGFLLAAIGALFYINRRKTMRSSA